MTMIDDPTRHDVGHDDDDDDDDDESFQRALRLLVTEYQKPSASSETGISAERNKFSHHLSGGRGAQLPSAVLLPSRIVRANFPRPGVQLLCQLVLTTIIRVNMRTMLKPVALQLLSAALLPSSTVRANILRLVVQQHVWRTFHRLVVQQPC